MSAPINYARIAELAREALDLGVTASKHVAAHMDMSTKTAGVAIHRARQRGHDVPALPRNPGTSVVTQDEARRVRHVIARRPQLRCECGRAYDLDELHLLGVHTAREHGRTPTITERTPSLGGPK